MKYNFKAVEIPARMAHLTKDKRGYPVPVMVTHDTDGRPHFAINDEKTRQRVIELDLCSICGVKLLRGRWSVGGPASAMLKGGCYLDPPMHYECLEYAMKVCPYIAMPSYSGFGTPGATLDPAKAPGMMLAIDQSMFDERPDPFVAVMHVGQTYTKYEGHEWVQYIWPKQPYRQFEFWHHGEKMPFEEGRLAALAYLKEFKKHKNLSPEQTEDRPLLGS